VNSGGFLSHEIHGLQFLWRAEGSPESKLSRPSACARARLGARERMVLAPGRVREYSDHFGHQAPRRYPRCANSSWPQCWTLSVLLPAVSQAGLVVEGSLGQGAQVSSPRAWERINFMVAPGVSIVSLLRLQLGIVGDFADTSGSKTDLELRPAYATQSRAEARRPL